jgi:hypothetical protein
MPGKEQKPGQGTRGGFEDKDISYGEAARSSGERSAGQHGVIDNEEDARAESEREERLPSLDSAGATDGEKIAHRQGKSGSGDVTDHESESERHGGEPSAPARRDPE